MPAKKQFLKSRPICKVTFKMPAEAVGDADTLHVVGDFNEWDNTATPMRKLKNGDFTVTVDLDTGADYQYRYLVDGETWVNDTEADRYEYSSFASSDNCVVSI